MEAQRPRALERRISILDSYALSLAKAEAAILLAGDAAMRDRFYSTHDCASR